jgi:hypothetical protein
MNTPAPLASRGMSVRFMEVRLLREADPPWLRYRARLAPLLALLHAHQLFVLANAYNLFLCICPNGRVSSVTYK